ncbi:MAG: YggS family pyridoxal phosphate-dependent enzyme [Gammaproteobacteria bacterium]|nr:YggS family pyridoxal phosphate-dependent enzyme [Gammaproteobacteria bacterium]
MDCSTRIETVNAAIGLAERRTSRSPGRAHLIAVSKARSAGEVHAAYEAGQRDFGENYLQEAVAKMTALSGLDIVWHFIGAIQSNKTRDIARRFHWVHTVDRARIASRLDAAAERPLDICVQVNIDAEPQKAGVAASDLPALLTHIRGLSRLRLRGLMAIPRADGDHRTSFRALRSLFDGLADDAGDHWDTLSMGMSDDFEIAIEEGATMVRIGTAIFGPRPTSARRRVPA